MSYWLAVWTTDCGETVRAPAVRAWYQNITYIDASPTVSEPPSPWFGNVSQPFRARSVYSIGIGSSSVRWMTCSVDRGGSSNAASTASQPPCSMSQSM
jgi:hypothetical protein